MKTGVLLGVAIAAASIVFLACQQPAANSSGSTADKAVTITPKAQAPQSAEPVKMAKADAKPIAPKVDPEPVAKPAPAPKPAPKPKPGSGNLAPIETPLSDLGEETNAPGPFSGAYDAKVGVVEIGDVPSSENVAKNSKFCLKVESAGAAKSGVTNSGKGSLAKLEDGKTYDVSVRVFSEEALTGLTLSFSNSTLGTLYVRHPERETNAYTTTAGKWYYARGEVSVPAGQGGPYAVSVLSLEEKEQTWFVDDLRITPKKEKTEEPKAGAKRD